MTTIITTLDIKSTLQAIPGGLVWYTEKCAADGTAPGWRGFSYKTGATRRFRGPFARRRAFAHAASR